VAEDRHGVRAADLHERHLGATGAEIMQPPDQAANEFGSP